MHFPKLKSKKLTPIMKIALAFVLAAFILMAVYFALDRLGYIRALQLGMQLQQQEQAQNEDKMVLDSLKKIYLLPDDFNPTMAVIKDIEVLKKEQPDFFVNAKNGDRVIVYPNLAIIYDYKANKIIKVGPVQVQQEQPAPQPENTEIPAETQE